MGSCQLYICVTKGGFWGRMRSGVGWMIDILWIRGVLMGVYHHRGSSSLLTDQMLQIKWDA